MSRKASAAGGTPGVRRKFEAEAENFRRGDSVGPRTEKNQGSRKAAFYGKEPRKREEEAFPAKTALRETDPAAPKFILTRRGMGYLFAE